MLCWKSVSYTHLDVYKRQTLYSGETVYHEAAYIGATIRHLMMNEGYQYQDFAIIARSLDHYRGVLDVALEQYEVPYFMDTPRSVYAEPLMCLVLYALQILKSNFSSDDMFVYLKTGLAGLTPYEISLLENYTFCLLYTSLFISSFTVSFFSSSFFSSILLI